MIQEQFQLTLPEALAKSWAPDAQGVTLVGLLDTLEIWTPSAWMEDVAHTALDYEALLESMIGSADE